MQAINCALNRLRPVVWSLVVMALPVGSYAAALAPQPDCGGEPALVRPGQYGAFNVEAYILMTRAMAEGDTARLRQLSNAHQIVSLPEVVVCVTPNATSPSMSSFVTSKALDKGVWVPTSGLFQTSGETD